jgi:hypothetical protein
VARILWVADVLRAAGLNVIEHAGWRTRGVEFSPGGVIIHQTRGPVGSSEAGEINVLINGREGLSGPISQLFVGRDGDWHIIASGRCNHVTVGQAGPFQGIGNSGLIGIEEHWTIGDPYPDVQHASYVRGVAAIIRHTGWRAPVGHKEHQPASKSDPHFDMNQFRKDVAAGGTPVTPEGIFDMGKMLIAKASDGQHWLCDGMTRRPIPEGWVGHLLYLGKVGAISVWTGTTPNEAPASVWRGCDDMLGLVAGATPPPATVSMTEADRQAIADLITSQLPVNLMTTDDARAALSAAYTAIAP